MTLHTRLEAGLEQLSFVETDMLLYGREGKDRARTRCLETAQGFRQTLRYSAQALLSAPGRTEIGGNHTDHNCGHVLAAAISLDAIAVVAKSPDTLTHVVCEGYGAFDLDFADLAPRHKEDGTSAALVRGVACGLRDFGYEIGPFCA